jgi:proline racemase
MEPMEIIHCHAEGEVGDVIVAGVPAPPGQTLWDQSQYIARDGHLRAYVLNEPRGGVFRHVNLIVPATHPDAAFGFIIMEPEDTPPMSGSNAMCVATVALETGMVPMAEPETTFIMQAAAGLVHVRAVCRHGKAESITLHNVPSFVAQQQVALELSGYPTVLVDTAFGGDSFVIAKASDFGFQLTPDEAIDLVDVGMVLRTAANEQLGFHHPELPDWQHISFAFLTGPLTTVDGKLTSTNTCVINPGKLDRSPTGTGCSAWMAVLHDRGLLRVGQPYVGRSIIDSTFVGQIVDLTTVGGLPAIIPTITGRAWVYGQTTWQLDPDDPWPEGYRLSDTWPPLR